MCFSLVLGTVLDTPWRVLDTPGSVWGRACKGTCGHILVFRNNKSLNQGILVLVRRPVLDTPSEVLDTPGLVDTGAGVARIRVSGTITCHGFGFEGWVLRYGGWGFVSEVGGGTPPQHPKQRLHPHTFGDTTSCKVTPVILHGVSSPEHPKQCMMCLPFRVSVLGCRACGFGFCKLGIGIGGAFQPVGPFNPTGVNRS